MESRIILIATIAFLGLGYHFVFLASEDDLQSFLQRVFPFVYWLLAAIGIARGVAFIDNAENNVMLTISLSVAAMVCGIVVGHLIARGLRYRVRHPGEDAYRDLYKDEGSGRGYKTL